MSYSVSAIGATREKVKTDIRSALDKVPEHQPVHVADIDQAYATAVLLVDLMHDDPERDLYCSVSGSIWKTETGVENISLNVSFSYTARKP